MLRWQGREEGQTVRVLLLFKKLMRYGDEGGPAAALRRAGGGLAAERMFERDIQKLIDAKLAERIGKGLYKRKI